jgi:hypothetical protein
MCDRSVKASTVILDHAIEDGSKVVGAKNVFFNRSFLERRYDFYCRLSYEMKLFERTGKT